MACVERYAATKMFDAWPSKQTLTRTQGSSAIPVPVPGKCHMKIRFPHFCDECCVLHRTMGETYIERWPTHAEVTSAKHRPIRPVEPRLGNSCRSEKLSWAIFMPKSRKAISPDRTQVPSSILHCKYDWAGRHPAPQTQKSPLEPMKAQGGLRQHLQEMGIRARATQGLLYLLVL